MHWNQRPDEPDEVYKCFLYYLHSRPRSLTAAYSAYCCAEHASKGVKKRPPGNWYEHSDKYDWKARATAYDIHHLTTTGATATVQFIAALEAYSSRALEALTSGTQKPTSWADITLALQTLGQFITADAVAAMREHARSEDLLAHQSQ